MRNAFFAILAVVSLGCLAAPDDVDPKPSCVTETTSTSGTGGAGGGCTSEAEGPLAGSRLQLRKIQNTDGSVQVLHGWYDSDRKENCEFRPMVNGGMRCVPVDNVLPTLVFLDAECTIPYAMPSPPYPCRAADAPRYKYMTWTTEDGCWTDPPIHVGTVATVATAHDGELYKRKLDGQCEPIGWGGAKLFYELGEELTPDHFVGEAQ